MASEIDNYFKDEEEFLRDHWDGAEKEQALQEIRGWIHRQLNPVVSSVTPIFKEIGDRFTGHTVKALREDWRGYDNRFVVSLDTSNATKTPEKILEKLVREWRDKNKPLALQINRLNYQTKIADVLRFRYVVNFLEDGKKLNRFLLREAGKPRSRLNEIFAFSRKKSNVHDPLITRKKGERSWKLFVVHREQNYGLELQICTLFQVAWDKKDHFLIYERGRKGMMMPLGDVILMKHVSDQLYVVDRQLDELREKIQKELRQGT